MTGDWQADLASRWLGGSVIAASDESFGEKENLLNPAPAAFEPGQHRLVLRDSLLPPMPHLAGNPGPFRAHGL